MESFKQNIEAVLTSNSSDYSSEFKELAKELMNNYLLIINSAGYKITEIEFYLNNKEDNLDIFAHKHDNYQTGQLRLHTSGVDIAIKNKNFYGGILIRGLKSDEHYIEGPWRVLETIIKSFSIDKQNSLEFKREKLEQLPIYQSPRAGLSIFLNKDIESQKKHIFNNWRFFTHPHEIKNNCRELIVFSFIKDGLSNESIRDIFKQTIELSTIEFYRRYIEKGKTLSDLNFQGKLTIEKKGNLYGMLLTLTQKHPNTLTP